MSARIDYLDHKKILILGMGREGRSSLQFLQTHAPDARIALADKNDPHIDGFPGFFGEDYMAHLGEFDLVLKSPGIPFVGVSIPEGTEITCQTDLFLRFAPCVSVGITGTKGKTTTTYMTHAVMDAIAGQKTGLLSGMERDMGGEVIPTHLTTPESLEMQQLFAEARAHHLPIVTAEISSQSYQVHRTYGQRFQYGIFLNIGPDHISSHEHPTMEDYLRCKEALLENSDTAVIVRSTDYFDHVLAAAQKARRTIVVGLEEDGCDYTASHIQKLPRGYAFTVTEKATSRQDVYRVGMDGLFNIENALVAIAVGRDMGGDPAVISAALEHLVVPGRADVMDGAGLKVYINYMHNGISCQAVLKALKKDYPDKFVTVVIGVAGQRSPARVQGVGEACGKYADRVFFSADDPDLEDPRDIDIRLAHAAADGKAEIIIEPDRTIAVERALREAPAGSIVVLGGKGSEDTQRVNGEYVYYESDPAIAKRVLAELEQRK